MSQVIQFSVDFGDCDPAGIVFYPNFYRWFDRGTHALAKSKGLSMAQLKAERGWICWPLVDTGAKFLSPASPGDALTLETSIVDWGKRTFKLKHLIKQAERVVCEGFEVRIIGIARDDDPAKLRTLELPDWMADQFGVDAAFRTATNSSTKSPTKAPTNAATDNAMQRIPAQDLLILDSIGYIAQPGFQIANKVIVSGSHGGSAAAGYILSHPQKPRLAFFNDAGGGKEHAGFAGLAPLEAVGVAAATYSHLSARIGEAGDGLIHGIVSNCNSLASALGIEIGATLQGYFQGDATLPEPRGTIRESTGQEPHPNAPAQRRFKQLGYQTLGENLGQLRHQIDALDEQLIRLMAQRAMLVKDAARFKADHFQVSAPQRQAQVYAKVRKTAEQCNLGFEGFEEVVEQTYRTMVTNFIAVESLYFDQLEAI